VRNDTPQLVQPRLVGAIAQLWADEGVQLLLGRQQRRVLFGIHLGVHDTTVALADATGTEIARRRIPTPVLPAEEGLREVIDFISSGELGRGDPELFRPIVDNLLGNDPFLLLADYQPYIDAQEQVSALWRDEAAWTRKSILNTARMGKFSSDRSIRDYCERVWKVQPSAIATA